MHTKATLLMALLRAVGVPCRLRGATVHKQLQKGLVNGLLYRLAPDQLHHSWVEVHHAGRWVRLEGVILDDTYLAGLRATLPDRAHRLIGYGVGTENLTDQDLDWTGHDTQIQLGGVTRQFGVYDDPDTFHAQLGPNLTGVKALIYRLAARHLMNHNVTRIRARGAVVTCPVAPPSAARTSTTASTTTTSTTPC